ncbi:ABC transporter permease subunit [Siculibacillus lacustris]|uniref:ABC transporter permease subunit n=1 Tax=Siculibacillus lacustris TaxID=1549641 RepID=A0A4Q9VTZ3_9HYPH|nr:ABC transporter permease [Siculibacillus lacustris]TBW39462.1 ABC transporter permease subunit [Siculibacillus lacustris]
MTSIAAVVERAPVSPGADPRARENVLLLLLITPAIVVFSAFWLLPIARLVALGASGEAGIETYLSVLTNGRYASSLLQTLALSGLVTLTTLAIAVISGLFLVRQDFFGRSALVAVMTLPLAFPGVVIGLMVIMLGGRQGIVGDVSVALFGVKTVFAYNMVGLFVGYVYFSIPRVILTVMAAAEKLDIQLEEAARSLGATPPMVFRDVILPGLQPALISSGAICFATSMGAFGTAFTLNAGASVLPMLIYTEFTLNANIAVAAALSVVLGLITWAVLALARSFAGSGVSAAG